MSTVNARRTLGRRETSQIIVCRPRHRSFSPLFFLFNDNAGEWMVARCRYLPSRIRSFDRAQRDRRMECPSALPRRIRRCGTVYGDCFSFRYVSASQSHTVSRHTVPASISLSAGRTKGRMSIESESRAQLDEKPKPRRRCTDL